MFDLAQPWWELVLRGALIYTCLFGMVRVSGKRTIGQFTAFDLLVVMLISEAVSNSLSGDDHSILGGLIVAATLIALNLLASFAGARSRRIDAILGGNPVLIGRDGIFLTRS